MVLEIADRGPCAASSDAGRAPRRRDARIHPAPGERARCRPGDARGLEVSPGCLLQDQLVQRQVGNRSAQPRVLSLEILQSLDLIALEPAKLLAPAVVRDLRNPNRAYRFGNALPLRHQHIHLAQLRNNLLGLVSLPRHRGPPWLESHTSGRTTSKGEDQRKGLPPGELLPEFRLAPFGRRRWGTSL